MSIGLIGRKVGMTQVFQDDGTMVAVSVLAIEPNTVTRLRTTDRDGYTAVQLGTEVAKKKLTKPEAGQLKDLPQVATIREFRVDSVDDFEVGQTVSLGDLFAAGDEVDVTGVSKGKGFAGAHQAPQLPPRSQDPRFGPSPRAGLHRPGHDPRSCLSRPEDGRPHGRRAGDHQEGARRARRHRPQPAARQRESPRRARVADPREEGLTMPSTPLYDRTGKTVGSVDLSDELFAAPVNTAVLHQVVTAQLAARRTGTHDTKTRGEVRGGGAQAVPPEGHRPRPPGLAQRAALPRRRRRLRAAPALVRAAAAAQDEAPRPAWRADRQARRRASSRSSTRSASRPSRPRSWPAVLRALEANGRVLVVAPGRDQTLELSARNLPKVNVILADSLNVVDLIDADLVLIEQPPVARIETVYGSGAAAEVAA